MKTGKFYEVEVWAKNSTISPNTDEFESIGSIIVEKKIGYATEIMTDFQLDIRRCLDNNVYIVFPFPKRKYNRELYIDKSDFEKDHLVTTEEVEEYLDSFNMETFCLKDEIEEDKRRKQDKNKIKQKIREYRGKYE